MKIKAFKTPANITGYYKDINKMYAKYIKVNKPDFRNTEGSSGIIPVNGHDIGNYVARYGLANFQIQAVMKLDGRLNFNKLVRAVRLSVDAEPVFGCLFVKGNPPYWKRLDDIDNVEFCSLEETDNPDEAIQRFLANPLDMDNGPMVKVRLIRSGIHDTLIVKVNHVCCDGAGAKEYIQLLADIYTRIDHRNSAFVPKSSIRSKNDHDRLFKAVGINNPKIALDPKQRLPLPLWRFPWKNGKRGTTRFAVCRLPSGQLDEMKSYAKPKGATINDLLLTAIYRAMFKISNTPYGIPMDIPVTLDLRRYLPDKKAEAIRNLTGGLIVRIPRKMHEPFERTLSRVMSETEKIKKGHPGIQNAVGAEYAENINFYQVCAFFKGISQAVEKTSKNPFYAPITCGLTLSNFGFVSNPPIKFGRHVVTDAYIIPPVVRAPGILLVASTYNGIITLAVGYYKPSICSASMEKLLNKIKDELIKCCK